MYLSCSFVNHAWVFFQKNIFDPKGQCFEHISLYIDRSKKSTHSSATANATRDAWYTIHACYIAIMTHDIIKWSLMSVYNGLNGLVLRRRFSISFGHPSLQYEDTSCVDLFRKDRTTLPCCSWVYRGGRTKGIDRQGGPTQTLMSSIIDPKSQEFQIGTSK